MLHALLPHADLGQEVSHYVVSETAFPPRRFLEKNVLCLCPDENVLSIDGLTQPGSVLGNSFNSLPQICQKHEGRMVLVHLYGGSWWRLFGLNPARFDTIKPLSDENIPGLEQLLKDLRGLRKGMAELGERLDAFLLPFFQSSKARGLAERARAEILKDLTISIAELADRTGYSQRHVQRAIRQTYGISPAHLKRVYRLLRSCNQGRIFEIDWLNVPAELQYADQSHWIKEFRKLNAMTPGEYSQGLAAQWSYYERGQSEPFSSEFDGWAHSSQWRAHLAAGHSKHDLENS